MRKLYKFEELSESAQEAIIFEYLNDEDYLNENEISNMTYKKALKIHLDFGNSVLYTKNGELA